MYLRKLHVDIKYLLSLRPYSFGENKKRKLTQEPEEEQICSICHETLLENEIITTKCNHVFHKDCLCRWFSSFRHNSCPLCREQFQPMEINELCGNHTNPTRTRRKINFDDYENPDTRRQLGIPQAVQLTWDD